jgi:hypothetical protein
MEQWSWDFGTLLPFDKIAATTSSVWKSNRSSQNGEDNRSDQKLTHGLKISENFWILEVAVEEIAGFPLLNCRNWMIIVISHIQRGESVRTLYTVDPFFIDMVFIPINRIS